jgi:hypothetical protein
VFGGDYAASIPFVSPLRLIPDVTRFGFSSCDSEFEHTDGIGIGIRSGGFRSVHFIARLSASEMRQARERYQTAAWVGMIQRGQQPALFHQSVVIQTLAR